MPETLYAPEATKTYGGSFAAKPPTTADDFARRQYATYGVPVYRLLKPFFSNDMGGAYHPEGAIITFEGVPNEQMEPMNAEAEAAMTAYLESLPPNAAGIQTFNGGTPELSDMVAALTSMRPKEPMPLVGADGARERVMAALAAGETPDPADLVALGAPAKKQVVMPHKDDDIPPMSGVEGDGIKKRGRPAKHPVSVVTPPSEAPQPKRIMGSVKMDGPDSQMSGPGANLTPGTRISATL